MVGNQADQYTQRTLIARNVKRTRTHQGLSQTELARRAGVDLASVYRVEKGVAVRLATIKKVALGLNIIFEDLLIDKTQPIDTEGFAVHRASRAKWFIGEDRRQRIPSDQSELSQSHDERRRLGRLGLVPWFMCPPLVIPENGPGIVLLEIYGERQGRFNAEFYEDGALYVLSGVIAVSIGGSRVDLAEGDWIAFKTKDLAKVEAMPHDEAATALWIGATRVMKRNEAVSPHD